MRRLAMVAIALTAAGAAGLGMAGCGEDSPDRAAGPTAPATAAGHPGTTVSVRESRDLGQVLVNGSGMILYASEQEEGGMIRCTGSCASIWVPLAAGSAAPAGSGDVGRLGVVTRPDGTRQVTANGHPLYTFASDSPGTATGDGLTDEFAGTAFTWHAVLAGGEPAGRSPARESPDEGYGY